MGNSSKFSYFNNAYISNSADMKQAAKAYDVYNNDHMENLRKKINDSMKDDYQRMVRVFPTFKLYFIETDAPQWGKLDDFYGYNSIESIQIHKSKDNAADVAVVRVTNFLGHLDSTNFTSDRHAAGARETHDKSTGKETQPELDDLFLQAGTRIQIRMGYSSSENELEDIFTGVITEVMHGDLVTFVAQGFGVELLQPKGYEWSNSLRGGIGADPLNVMSMLITSRECKHFGRYGIKNLEVGEVGGWRVKGKWLPFVDKPQDDNIFIDNAQRSIFGFLQTSEEKRQFIEEAKSKNMGFWESALSGVGRASGKNHYRIYKTTAWEVFKDMERRFPGYALAVLPYDERATLFFGSPNQLYNYTVGSKDSIIQQQQAQNKELEKSGFGPMLSRDNRVSFSIGSSMGLRSESNIKLWNNFVSSFQNDSVTSEEAKLVKDNIMIAIYEEDSMSVSSSQRSTNSKSLINFFIQELDNDPSNLSKYFKIKNENGQFVLSPADDFDMEDESPGITKRVNNLYVDKLGNIKKIDEVISDLPEAFKPDGRFKPFRSYHVKTSFHHIIANNIKISMDDFYNRIVVYFYGALKGSSEIEQQKVSKNNVILAADDSIPEDFWRTKVVFEPNAETYYQARNYALGNLLQTTQALYDGELVILGDPSIKPHDHVFIHDAYTGMYGTIEVKEVTHDFSRETGFVTTIVPQLVVYVNNPPAIMDGSQSQIIAGGIAAVLFGISKSIVSAGVVLPAVMVGGSLMIPCIRDTFFPLLFGKLGFGKSYREPIGISPLVYEGRPFVAGFEGMKTNSWVEMLVDNWHKMTEEFLEGYGIARRTIMEIWLDTMEKWKDK